VPLAQHADRERAAAAAAALLQQQERLLDLTALLLKARRAS